jgi:hypothetical protein
MLFDIILIFVLLLISAFFSASETSLTTVSKPYLLKKEQKGSKAAKLINKIINNNNTNLITSILVGNTFVNILIGSFVTSLGVHFGEDDLSVFYLSLISTTLILIFGEILPKTYSFNNSFQVASFTAPVILIFMKLIKPIVFVFLKINNIFLMLTKSKGIDEDASIDNIRGAIEMFKRNDNSLLDEKAMLHGVLDLTELRAEDVMLHRKKVFCINSNDDKDFILDKIINSNFTRIPVYENNMENIIGIIDIRDILKIKKLGDNNFLIKSLMREPFILPNTSPLVDVLTQFKEKQERMALVVDEYGSFLGIITLKDIVEEVFGDLNHKERNLSDSGKSIKKLEDGSIIVDGDLSIRDVNKKMKWELPDEEVTTIAGLLLFETGSIPKIGSLFAICGFIFEVIEKKKHQITKIKISKLEK